jgi:SAM-dependent methyltransferase
MWPRRRASETFRRPEELWRELIAAYAPGRTLVDVGCLWNVHGAYAFHAAAHGARAVTGVDVNPATPEFERENRARGEPVRFIQADLDDPTLAERVGVHDVVYSSGVLYHMPNPLFSLEQLRRLCRETMILASACYPEGSVPHTAVFLPFLDAEERKRYQFGSAGKKLAIDTPYLPARGYANWFWAFSPSAVRALARTAGFEVVESHESRHNVTLVCRPNGAGVSREPPAVRRI